MAKKPEVNSIVVPFAEVMWNKAFNRARPTGNYGDKNQREALIRQMSKECWWKGPNGLVETSAITDTWKVDGKEVPLSSLVAAEMERRNELWKFYKLQAEQDSNKAYQLVVFENAYVRNGKLVEPKYFGLTGNRRGNVYLEAMMERRAAKVPDGEAAPELDWTIPIRVDDFSDPNRRLDEQVKENVGKTQGNLGTSALDMLLIAKEMLSLGSTQAKLRTRFGDSQGVKMYYICVLNSKYPDLKIVDRIQADPTSADYIPIASIKYPVLQGFAQRFDETAVAEYNKARAKKNEEPVGLLTREDVQEYFADVRKNPEGGGVKMLDKNGVLSISQVNDNPIVKATAKRIYTNAEADIATMKKLGELGPACHSLMTLQEQGDLPNAEKILESLTMIPKGHLRDNIEKQILALFDAKQPTAPAGGKSEKKQHANA